MQSERLGYRSWKGKLRASAWRWWPIARTGIQQVFTRKIVWVFLLLGATNFLFHFAMIYFLSALKAKLFERGARLPPIAEAFVFTGSGESYRNFIWFQGTLVMLLLAFCGAVLVGNDFRFRAIGFYLSKPIGKIHYFLGKLAAAGGIAALITLLPALLLFVEYGAFTDSLDYYRNSQRILWSILAYGTLVSLASATLLLGIAALFQRTLPILVAWGTVFVLLPAVERILNAILRHLTGEGWAWGVINFWRVLSWISKMCFGIKEEIYRERLPWALAALSVWLGLALWAFWRRVRAVEVVR